MMSVSEYASDVGKTVSQIMELCKKLEIKVNDEDDFLDDEAIILLDNELDSISDEVEEFDEEEFEDSYEEELEEVKSDVKSKQQVQGSKPNFKKSDNKKSNNKKNDKSDFNKKRKEMYKHKEKLQSNLVQDSDNVVLYTDNMTVSELANSLGVSVTEVIKKLMGLGMMMTINASVDFDTSEIIANEFNKVLKKETTRDETNFEELEMIDDVNDLVERPPVVTIMGHVDHGKTTLLDTIRKSNVAEGEAGGITQAIGAYQINTNGKLITFIDTPGHAAFTEMRARGASITDIVIIIVAADDGVMPQTKEAIDHAKAANVPIIVAVNKMDKPDANPERVLTEMSNYGIVPDSWGGDTMFVNISAKTGMGIDELLDRILLISELLELKANPSRYASGTVIESKLDKNSGVSCTLLIQNGVPVKDIQIWLGHSNFQTTLRYAHADIENKKVSANVIENKLALDTKKEQITKLAI